MGSASVSIHLDYPSAVPAYAEFELKGWIVSDAPIVRVFLDRPGEHIRLALSPRPDVAAAFPQRDHAIGFSGFANIHFVREGGLNVQVETAGRIEAVLVPLRAGFIEPEAHPPEDFPVTAALKEAKLRRLAGRLACPHCRTALPAVPARPPACPRCGAPFRVTTTQLDFFTPEQRAQVPAPGETTASQGGMDEVAHAIIRRYADGLILDCGAGLRSRIYPNVVNLEIMDYPSTDVRAFNEALPFADATFDAVFTFATLEHVKDPFQSAKEIMRVLKPGGTLYSMVPLLAPFHGFPNHYYNMTIEGHKHLYGTGLELFDASVPLSGRPVFALTWILQSWLAGLPAEHRAELLDLRVRDLVGNPYSYLQKNYVRYLSAEANMEIATMTRIIGRKR